MVADGMGGHNAGDVASKLAVENTIKCLKFQSQDKGYGRGIKESYQRFELKNI